MARSLPPLRKSIDGKAYRYVGLFVNKTQAEQMAKVHRWLGASARTVSLGWQYPSYPNYYALYIRGRMRTGVKALFPPRKR